MLGQWEVVGKSKKKQNAEKVKLLTKAEQRKVIENGPKVEEILPLSQVQTLFDALSKDVKENKKPGKENSVKDNGVKKPQKKSQAKKKESVKEKHVLPKNLDTALKLINKKELSSELEMGRAKFPDAPLVWLKGLVGYLNTRLTVENVHPVFEGRSQEYPHNLIPGDLREVLRRSVLEVNETVAQALFEWCLTAMANDMSRGDKVCEAVLGFKLIMQLLAFHNPHLVISAVPKVKTLLASYHNQQSIGLSLLWSMGQGGYRNIGVGLKVWQQVMFPMVDLRLYSTYVVNYLQTLLSLRPGSPPLQADVLLPTLNVLSAPPSSVPINKHTEFQEMSSKLLALILDLPYESTFLPLFPVLLQQLDETTPARLQRELENVLLTGLLADSRVSVAWLETYPRLRPQSRLLLTHLGRSWKQVPKKSSNHLKKMLAGFQSANRLLEKQGASDAHAHACERLCKELLHRMATARVGAGAAGGFPWRRANLLLLAAIAALWAYDVRRHGSLRASSTGRLLHDIGVLPCVEEVWIRIQFYSHLTSRWLQENGPAYYHETCEVSRPYLVKAQELLLTGTSYAVAACKSAYAYAQEKVPLVSEWVESWVPGLRDQAVEIGIQIWEQGKVYSVAGGKALIQYGQGAVTWARTNVFVGSWSPDNLQQYSLAVLNVTQQYALGTYDWLYQKVQTFSKVE